MTSPRLLRRATAPQDLIEDYSKDRRHSPTQQLYRQGRCDAMAIALHRVTGLPLVAITGQRKDGKGGWCNEQAHVGVSPGEERWIDVDGLHRGIPKDRLMFLRPPDRIRLLPTTEKVVRTLYTRSGVPESEVTLAIRFIARDPTLRELVRRYTRAPRG